MNNVRDIVKYLGLKKPYKIELKSRKHKKMDAAYWGLYKDNGVLESHLIRIYLGNDGWLRDIDTLIAHELIHAWEEENGVTTSHGLEFQEMAINLENVFKILNIYLPDVDE